VAVCIPSALVFVTSFGSFSGSPIKHKADPRGPAFASVFRPDFTIFAGHALLKKKELT
jgi:hypothetical protein